ncbi:MAG: DUF975 family protein [Lachnospiraceae bacterium]
MFTRKEIKEKSREQIKGNIGISFLCIIIYLFIDFSLSSIPAINLITIWILLAITSPLDLGLTKVFMEISRGNKPNVSTLFAGFSQFGQSFLCFLLLCIPSLIYIFLSIIPAAVIFFTNSVEAIPLFTIWMIFLYVIYLYIYLSFSMIYYIMEEQPNLSATDVFKASRQMMKGHKWDYFVFQLSFILWYCLGILTLGIAFIYIIPYISVATANYYHNIKGFQSLYEPWPKEIPAPEPAPVMENIPPVAEAAPPSEEEAEAEEEWSWENLKK